MKCLQSPTFKDCFEGADEVGADREPAVTASRDMGTATVANRANFLSGRGDFFSIVDEAKTVGFFQD